MTCVRVSPFVGALCACFFAAVVDSEAAPIQTIANWTFETSQPALANSTTISGIVPEDGAGTASGVHARSQTDWSSPVGNGSDRAFSSNEWTVGDYYQFQVATTGLFKLGFAWDQTRSTTGPSTFFLQYSTDGSSFTTFDSQVVPANSWSSLSTDLPTQFSRDLSAVSSIWDQPTVYFRLTMTTPVAAGTGGTNRIDNVVITGQEIPEPTTLALCGFALVGLIAARRKMFA